MLGCFSLVFESELLALATILPPLGLRPRFFGATLGTLLVDLRPRFFFFSSIL
jgi:hypothetical protein